MPEIRSPLSHLSCVKLLKSETILTRRAKSDPSSFAPNIVVCIPAYNESCVIGNVVQRARSFCSNVLVCDDGSTDDTSSEAAKNGATVLRHSSNHGKGAALRTLLKQAWKLAPEAIVTLDGDGQHDPSDIPRLVEPVLSGRADVVVGSRFHASNRIPSHRRVGNFILSLLTNWRAGTRLQDTQSGFRAYASGVLRDISIVENGMGVDSQILIQIARKGFRIQEKEVSVNYSGDTSTFNPVSHMIRVIWSISRDRRHGGHRALPIVRTFVPMFLPLTILVLGFLFPSVSSFLLTALLVSLVASVGSFLWSQSSKFNRWNKKPR